MIARVPVATETRAPGGETNAYVVGREALAPRDARTGSEATREHDALLVDPAGRAAALDDHRDGVAHVAVTHTHPDHVGGVADYAAEAGATVWALAGHEDRFERATGVAPDRTFRDGTTLPTEPPVEVLATPGHAPDHVAFAVADGDGDEDAEELLVGDLAVAEGSVMVGASDGDMAAYLDSLRRLRHRDPDRLHPGHGPAIDDPAARLPELLAHRLDRERRVRAAVEEGTETVDDIVDAAYDKDLSGVRDLAAETVRAHLQKLAEEGVVEWDGERAWIAGERG